MKYLVLALFFVCSTSFGFSKASDAPKPPTLPTPPPMEEVVPTPTPVVAWTPAPLAWENGSAERKAWSTFARKELKQYLPGFSKASDRKDYCAKYDSLTDDQKNEVWLTMVVEIARYESGFKLSSSMVESNSALSQGLYQLTYGDPYCPKNKAGGDLNAYDVNMRCAFKILNRWVSADGVIAAGGYVASGAPPDKGAAQYWSVIRVPDVHDYKNSAGKLVKARPHQKAKIQAATKALPFCA